MKYILLLALAWNTAAVANDRDLCLIADKDTKVINSGVVRKDGLLMPEDIREYGSNANLGIKEKWLEWKCLSIIAQSTGQSFEAGKEHFELSVTPIFKIEFSEAEKAIVTINYSTYTPGLNLKPYIQAAEALGLTVNYDSKPYLNNAGTTSQINEYAGIYTSSFADLKTAAVALKDSVVIRSKSYNFLRDLAAAKRISCRILEMKVSTELVKDEAKSNVKFTSLKCVI